MTQSLLLVEDDEAFAYVAQRALSARGYQVQVAHSLSAAKELSEQVFNYAILDLNLDGHSSLPLIPLLLEHNSAIRILVLTGYASIATAVEAIKLGAANYLPKPADMDEIMTALLEKAAPTELDNTSAADPMSVKKLEWEHIQKVLQENNGNISATARQLKMHRRTLQRKLQKRPVKE